MVEFQSRVLGLKLKLIWLILEDENMFNHVRFMEMSLFVFVFFFLIWVLGLWTNICLIFLESEINKNFFKKIENKIKCWIIFLSKGTKWQVYIKTTSFWDDVAFDGELINGYEWKDILPNDQKYLWYESIF